MNTIEFTPSQQTAIESFESFLSSDDQVFMLKGAAGTGKTTLVKEFLKILNNKDLCFHLMAPTGRAAHVIGDKTKTPAFTIHRSIYLLNELKSTSQNKEDEDDGGLHARFVLKNNEDSLNTIYIVDESSLVSDIYSENESFFFGSGHLLSDLFSYIRNRKIVFIGDYAQLPPVGMSFSPALDKDYIENNFNCKVHEVILREVLRQSINSTILSNVSKIRDSIENNLFNEFKIEEGDDCKKADNDILQPYFDLSPDKPNTKSAIIAFSNKQVVFYNNSIRRHYYGENAPRLLKGDLLMIARNNYAYDEELFNGNIVLVESCDDDTDIETREVRVKLGKDRIESITLRFRKAFIKFKSGNLNVTLLDNFLDDPASSIGGLLARALIVDFNNRLPDFIKSQLPTIKKLLRKNEKLSTEQKELYDNYLQRLQHDKHYNAVCVSMVMR